MVYLSTIIQPKGNLGKYISRLGPPFHIILCNAFGKFFTIFLILRTISISKVESK